MLQVAFIGGLIAVLVVCAIDEYKNF